MSNNNDRPMPDYLKRILRFIIMPSSLIITIIAIFGTLFAVQSKKGLEIMADHSSVNIEVAKPGENTLSVAPPIHHYEGPIIVTLDHVDIGAGAWLNLNSGNRLISQTRLDPGDDGQKTFYLFKGDFTPSEGLRFQFLTDNQEPLEHVVEKIRFEFPKVGEWMIPSLLLWFALLILILCFGLICALLWDSPVNVTASYAATVVMLVLASHFGGLEMAWRISDQWAAVIMLLVIVILFKGLIMPRKQVTVKPKA